MTWILWAGALSVETGAQHLMDDMRRAFRDPPRAHTQMPFWFWNGAVDEEGIRRQIAQLEEKGVHGFVIHARMGLDPEIGYMSDRWLSLVRTAVAAAAEKEMLVYLYDEAMYPSGSAHGEVVRGRPDLKAQGLRMMARRVRGPEVIRLGIPLERGEQLVSVVLMQWSEATGGYVPQTARVVSGADARVPAGEWGLFTFVQTPTEGVIRGVHWDEEDNKPGAPAAADLLNPEATSRFIALTHERYRESLEPFFGKTVLGIFTDEPDLRGRRAKRDVQPWTTGLEVRASSDLGYDFRLVLPFLFGERATDGRERVVRADFRRLLSDLLNESYYRPLSEWCDRHGLALTGHPAGAGDMAPLRYFQHPGQDVVWRWVLPGPTAVQGEQSTNAKTASSAAAQYGRRIVANEAFGAYGWRLTMDEMKWLSDWLFVRGTNRLIPHAFYYSDEPPRLLERPPDLGWYNLWWPHYAQFSHYTRRMSWLMSQGRPVVEVAVLQTPEGSPWRVASRLLQSQIDYHYLELSRLDDVTVSGGVAAIGDGTYTLMVLDSLQVVSSREAEQVLRLLEGGVRILAYKSNMRPHPLLPGVGEVAALLSRIAAHDGFIRCDDLTLIPEMVDRFVDRDVRMDPPSEDLRVAHRARDGVELYLLTNEGDGGITGTVSFRQRTVPEEWDAESGSGGILEQASVMEGRTEVAISLPPRGSRVFVFDVQAGRPARSAPPAPVSRSELVLPRQGWRVASEKGLLPRDRLGDWTVLPGMQAYSGTVWYEMQVDVPDSRLRVSGKVSLDLGRLHAFATVEVNGEEAGTRMWQPFVFDVSPWVRPGLNRFRIGVTNTRANELTSDRPASGLFGPVRLLFEEPVDIGE